MQLENRHLAHDALNLHTLFPVQRRKEKSHFHNLGLPQYYLYATHHDQYPRVINPILYMLIAQVPKSTSPCSF